MLPRGTRKICMFYLQYHMFPGQDEHCLRADATQPLPTAGEELNDLHPDL